MLVIFYEKLLVPIEFIQLSPTFSPLSLICCFRHRQKFRIFFLYPLKVGSGYCIYPLERTFPSPLERTRIFANKSNVHTKVEKKVKICKNRSATQQNIQVKLIGNRVLPKGTETKTGSGDPLLFMLCYSPTRHDTISVRTVRKN